MEIEFENMRKEMDAAWDDFPSGDQEMPDWDEPAPKDNRRRLNAVKPKDDIHDDWPKDWPKWDDNKDDDWPKDWPKHDWGKDDSDDVFADMEKKWEDRMKESQKRFNKFDGIFRIYNIKILIKQKMMMIFKKEKIDFLNKMTVMMIGNKE